MSPALVLVLRIGVSVAFLAVLIWRIPHFDVDDLFPKWTASTTWWLIAAAATLLVAYVLQTIRWAQVLRPLGFDVPFRRLFTEFLAGQFISNVLPAAVGGDVVRIARLGRDLDDRAAAFASVALERLTGWFVLPFISLAVLIARPSLLHHGAASATAVGIDLFTLVALGVLLGVAASRRWSESARTATGWRRWLGSVHLGLDAIRSTPTSVIGIVVAGAAFQITQCLSVWMTARALQMPAVTLVVALAFFPPTAIAQNLPVGLGGLGVREGGFILFFGALGAAHARAVSLGLVGYLLTLATSALGAPAFALGGWRREMQKRADRVTEASSAP
jgi:hypothetical protein